MLSRQDKYRRIPAGDQDFPEETPTSTGSVWTAEPVLSPEAVHEAILSVESLRLVATKRFDDVESSGVPPRSKVYADLHQEWLFNRGKLFELRTGEEGVLTMIDNATNDMIERGR
ncbi:MAG: hypothetical protein M3Q14_03205 [bacterium]|nr:hypothetical protein [bacterium]